MTAPAKSDGLMTVAEVMAFLRLSRSTVHQMIRRGDLAAVRFGRRTLFRRAAVDELIAAHEKKATQRKKRGRR